MINNANRCSVASCLRKHQTGLIGPPTVYVDEWHKTEPRGDNTDSLSYSIPTTMVAFVLSVHIIFIGWFSCTFIVSIFLLKCSLSCIIRCSCIIIIVDAFLTNLLEKPWNGIATRNSLVLSSVQQVCRSQKRENQKQSISNLAFVNRTCSECLTSNPGTGHDMWRQFLPYVYEGSIRSLSSEYELSLTRSPTGRISAPPSPT